MKKILLALIFIFNAALSPLDTPALVTKTFDGKIFNLEEKRGKIVLVTLWASWCTNCHKEMAILEELKNKYGSRGLEIIGLSIDGKRDFDQAQEVAKNFSFENSFLKKAEKSDFEKPDYLPMTYVIDREGKLRATIAPKDRPNVLKDFEDVLKPLVKK